MEVVEGASLRQGFVEALLAVTAVLLVVVVQVEMWLLLVQVVLIDRAAAARVDAEAVREFVNCIS